ncbi:hypothetical protein [Desulfosoma caldarium]|uniref:hypothetical protein n=1 Tax=Desulfosoma caldarium TaxID=610254 RepID=UPI001B8639A4|nr:hypothetical protein [Desulfosoma caldarium]
MERLAIDAALTLDPDTLRTEAMGVVSAGAPQFSFALCRPGTNKNGHHFTAEDLSSRSMMAANKKVDLQRSQEFNDIVVADYLKDDHGGLVECVAGLHVCEPPLAYKLMKRGVISQIFMVCDDHDGQGTVWRNRFQNKADCCTHPCTFKGRDVGDPPVFDIPARRHFHRTGTARPQRRGREHQDSSIGVPCEPARPIPTRRKFHNGKQKQTHR